MAVKILECRKFTSPKILSQIPRIVKDYEIDIEIGPERTVIINGEEHKIKYGDVCVRKPGQTVCGKGYQNTILLTLDFSGTQSDVNYSRNVDGKIQDVCNSELLTDLCGVIRPFSEYTFTPIYTELLELSCNEGPAVENLINELLHKLNAEICRINYVKYKPQKTYCSEMINYMQNNLHKEITLDDLSAHVNLNKNYLVRLFKETYGNTPINVLIGLRMERASDLISNTDMPISDIADVCGYNSTSYFIAEYKKHFGITPLKQRKIN